MDIKVFYQELGKRLKSARRKVGLSQAQLAKEIGLTRQYIIQIEKGKAKHPTLGVILNYLDACNVRWTDFFVELKQSMDKINYDQIINKIGLSSATGLTLREKQKVDRDIAYYQMRIDSRKGRAKPLSEQQKHQAVVKFGKYRTKIEPVEAEIQKKLGEINTPIVLNQVYKDFARECYGAIKKIKNQPLNSLKTQNKISVDSVSSVVINQIIDKWVEKGLNRDILEKVKDIIIRGFTQQK